MLSIVYPSKRFLEKTVGAVQKGNNIKIKVTDKFRKNLLIEYLPYLIKNKDQKGKIWKTIFRWFYLLDFISLYGTVMERDDYFINYSFNAKEMIIIFEKRGG